MNVADVFPRLVLSLLATGTAPGSFYVVQVLREPAFRARRAHPAGQCGRGPTVAGPTAPEPVLHRSVQNLLR